MGKRSYDKGIPFCFQERTGCFAYQDGKCAILTEPYGTNEKACPFYKLKPKKEKKSE